MAQDKFNLTDIVPSQIGEYEQVESNITGNMLQTSGWEMLLALTFLLVLSLVAFTSIWRKSYYRYSQISLERVVRPERVARPGMQTILLSE
eukprot:symbB.v1.2.019095.t1/scaffold1550.1/size112250/5